MLTLGHKIKGPHHLRTCLLLILGGTRWGVGVGKTFWRGKANHRKKGKWSF